MSCEKYITIVHRSASKHIFNTVAWTTFKRSALESTIHHAAAAGQNGTRSITQQSVSARAYKHGHDRQRLAGTPSLDREQSPEVSEAASGIVTTFTPLQLTFSLIDRITPAPAAL